MCVYRIILWWCARGLALLHTATGRLSARRLVGWATGGLGIVVRYCCFILVGFYFFFFLLFYYYFASLLVCLLHSFAGHCVCYGLVFCHNLELRLIYLQPSQRVMQWFMIMSHIGGRLTMGGYHYLMATSSRSAILVKLCCHSIFEFSFGQLVNVWFKPK